MESPALKKKLRELMAKYKYALLVLLLGIGLMLLPSGNTSSSVSVETPPEPHPDDLEIRLEQILSQISGAGKVDVLLTEKSGSETLYQLEGETDSDESSIHTRESVIIVEDTDNRESGLIRRVDPPNYLGAVIACQGADNPQVKLAIVESVRCVTGLGANQINVVKMK